MGQQNFEKVNLFLSDFERFELRKELIQLAFTNNWFKIFVPEYLGGAQLNLTDGIDVIYQIASKNTALGWCVSLGAGAGVFYKYLDESQAELFFRGEKSVIAGSGNYNINAELKEDKIALKGSWNYCSGSAHASAFTGGLHTANNEKFAFIINANQVETENTWSFFALKPTSSFTFHTNSLIEKNQLFKINELKIDDSYHVPEIHFDLFAALCLYATKIGILNCFVKYFFIDFEESYNRLENDFNELIGVSKNQLNELFKISKDLDLNHRKLNQSEIYATLQESSKNYNKLTKELFHKICFASGMKMYDEKSITHQLMKDFILASQHSFVNPI